MRVSHSTAMLGLLTERWLVSDTGRPTWLPVDPGNLALSTALPHASVRQHVSDHNPQLVGDGAK